MRAVAVIDKYDVLIVGSGFGGSVAALRLAEKGYRVAVLEAGRRYGPEDFARTNWDLRRSLWIPKLFCHGILRLTLLRDVLDRGLTVAIGSETGVAPLAECSLIVAPYLVGGEQAGTIGVLGPTRMNYQETLAAVAVVSQRLSKLLTEG